MGSGAFFALASAKPKKSAKARSQKKSAKALRKKSANKRQSDERERKKREFALLPPLTVEIRFQSTKPFGRGKARVLE